MLPLFLTGSAVLTPPRRARRDVQPPQRPPDDGGGDPGRDGEGEVPEERGFFALGLVVVGVTTLFLVLVAVALLLRRPAPDWRAAAVELPLVRLAASTLALVVSSACFERAARRPRRARRELVLGLVAGAGFLVLQGWLWLALVAAGQAPAAGGYLAVLYALTGLHALHVLGGLGFLARLACSAQARASALRLAALYWHFMGFLWAVVLALLVFGR